LPVTAGARGTGLRGRLTAADRMNLTWLRVVVTQSPRRQRRFAFHLR